MHTNFFGLQTTERVVTKVAVEKYTYCEHGNLVKTERFVQGEENTKGVQISEQVCDEKGNVIKSFTYNSLDSSTKFYSEKEYAENGRVKNIQLKKE